MRNTRAYVRETLRISREYQGKLASLVDEIYEKACDGPENGGLDYSWYKLAEESHLSYNTVYRLGMRLTKYPRLETLYKLAKAVGMEVNLVNQELRIARAA